jgi:hypothetical protein
VPELPEWFAEIVRRLLSKDRNLRFQSAAELAALLKQCLAHVAQPHLAALPESLLQTDRPSRSKTLLRRFAMLTPWMTCAALGSWLLLLQVGQTDQGVNTGNQSDPNATNIALNQAAESRQSDLPAQHDTQASPMTAVAGKLVLKVTKADAIDQLKLRMKSPTNRAANMLLEHLAPGSTPSSANNGPANAQPSGGTGNVSGRSGGNGGGFARGSTATAGSVTSAGQGDLVRPNIAVALKVEPNENGIYELENVKAVDEKGHPVPWMGPNSFNFFDPAFEKGLEGELTAYFQEENETESLTISGVLKVTPGRRIEVRFPNGKPATRKSGEHSFVLEDLQWNERGIHVTLSLPQLVKKRGNQFGNPQAMMKQILDQQGAVEVLILDSEGVAHFPGAAGSAGGSSNSSGGGGGNGNLGGSFKPETQSRSTQTFTFGGLPEGREINSVVVRAIEKTGKPQSHSFQLNKVPIPYKTR